MMGLGKKHISITTFELKKEKKKSLFHSGSHLLSQTIQFLRNS